MGLLTAVLLILLGLTVLAGPASAAGSVTGTVTDTEGHLLSGSVVAWPTDGSGAPGNQFADGVISTSFPDGTYRLEVRSTTLDGTSRWYVAGNPSGTTVKDEATVVTFPGPAVEITMVFPEIARVSGRVVGTDGLGVPGAYVLRSRQGTMTSVVADSQGYYDFGHLRAGAITVTAGKQGSHAQTSVAYEVPASGVVVVPDVVITRYSTVTGVVTAGDGTPLEGVEVMAGNPGYAGSGTTDASGRYTIEQLPAATFDLGFRDTCGDYAPAAGSVTVAEEGTGTADQVLTPEPAPAAPSVAAGGTITMSDGSSPRCVKVYVGAQEANVGVDGTWQVESPGGEVSLSAHSITDAQTWLPTYWPDAWNEADTSPVNLSPSIPTSGLDMTVHRAAWITATTTATSGTPQLDVWTPGGARVARAVYGSGSVGSFKVAVRPGSWRLLLVGGSNATFLPRWFGDAASLATATTYQLSAGQTVAADHLVVPQGLVATAPPVVTGSPRPGSTLSAGTGTWNLMTGTAFTTQWRRGATVVGTGPTYVVSAADVGHALTAVVTATSAWPGRSFAAPQASAPVKVSKAATLTRLRATSPGRRTVRLVVRVSSAVRPDGTVTIRRGSKVLLRRVALDASGRAVVRLRRQPSGKATYSAAYSGSASTAPSRARAGVRVP